MGETGEKGFRRVGGRLCLDFVNTVGEWASRPHRSRGRDWRDHPERERLTSYGALLEWAVFVGVLRHAEARRLHDAALERRPRASAVLARARRLRHATYRLLRASIEGWTPDSSDVALLDDEVRVARLHQRLGGELPLTLSWDDDPHALDRMLWPIALDAAALLSSTDLNRVGQCLGDRCGWMFLDESRGRRRKWCDMADCGNLAKVRRFRARAAAGS